MKTLLATGAAALALTSTLVLAQGAPESLLPPGFDDPPPAEPTATPAPPATAPAAPAEGSTPPSDSTGTPVIQPLPERSAEPQPAIDLPDDLPSLEELEAMNTDELDELLGLKPRYDIPPAARRSLSEVGIVGPAEGGFATASLEAQPASLVRAIIAGMRGPLVSRWGHILVRRTLASRLTAPDGMDPVDFAALRAAALNAMGEYTAARGIAQDVDTNNWHRPLTDAALEAYVATGDIVGACPAVQLQGSDRDDGRWQLWQSICAAYAGQGVRAATELRRALSRGTAPAIDVLLAQRFAGAAGSGRQAVNLEWDEVDEMTPWRYALANAVGAEIPERLLADLPPYYSRAAAIAPTLAPADRLPGAHRAAGEGILSASAMVSLYSEVLNSAEDGDGAETAARLRTAYTGDTPAARLAAMRAIWGGGEAEYSRLVLTAYASARMPASEEFRDEAPTLIASMLSAGLDRDAMEWSQVVGQGGLGWALLALARSEGGGNIAGGQLDAFVDEDDSDNRRKSQFLVAALAGLGRIDDSTARSYSDRLAMELSRDSKWTRTIERAAAVDNAALVALLAGLGMQGDAWGKMTARHLYHIVSALNRVGLSAEARMIAAEAVARA